MSDISAVTAGRSRLDTLTSIRFITQLFLPVVSGSSDWDGHRLIIPKENLLQKQTP